MQFVMIAALAILGSTLENPTSPEISTTDYQKVDLAISETMRAHHYNPAELKTDAYRQIEAAVTALAADVQTDEAFIDGFRDIWKKGPFSHVELSKAKQSAKDLAAYLDDLRVGEDAVALTWNGDAAILTVNTMMGVDTIEHIDAAYNEITSRDADKLIIDLRQNGGGAFAVRPLVGHLISEPIDGGGFVSQSWNAAHDSPPTRSDIVAVAPWEGWSIRAFWADVQEAPLVRLSFSPIEPVYDGPAFMLTSSKTASAAELATDALSSSGRAVVIGETTAGEMLSQKIYDIPGGFHLSLPIADYYSVENGRIEGAGVMPDIETDAASALAVALQQ